MGASIVGWDLIGTLGNRLSFLCTNWNVTLLGALLSTLFVSHLSWLSWEGWWGQICKCKLFLFILPSWLLWACLYVVNL